MQEFNLGDEVYYININQYGVKLSKGKIKSMVLDKDSRIFYEVITKEIYTIQCESDHLFKTAKEAKEHNIKMIEELEEF